MRLTDPYRNYTKPGMVDEIRVATLSAAMAKLQKYEDVEERGQLVILPCKVGDMVYYRRGRDIIGDTVERIIIDGIDNQVLVGAHKAYMFCDFGRNVFLTREEAEFAMNRGQDDE